MNKLSPFFLLFLLVVACGQNDTTKNLNSVSIPIPSKAISLPSITAYVTIDDSPTKYDLTISDGVASGIIDDSSIDFDTWHTIYLHFLSNSIEFANSSKDIYCDIYEECSVAFESSDYEYPDDDNDGVTNLDELLDNTDPNIPDCVITTFAHGNFERSYFMEPKSGNTEYCGVEGSSLPNPFKTSMVSLFITKACTYEVGYDTYFYSSEDSKWQVFDATNTLTIEFPFVEFINCSTSLHFITSDGISCSGSITNIYANDSISLDCNKNDLSCKVDYEEP